jgi:hypothetical protein
MPTERFALPGEPATKSALESLRLGEPPLGNLTWDEQNWLGTAMAHLMHIYRKRDMGGSGNSCYCIFAFDPGHIYVQFLAPFDQEGASKNSSRQVCANLTR